MGFSDTHEEFPFQSPVLPPPLKAPLDTCLPGNKTTPFSTHNLASLVFKFFYSPDKIFAHSALSAILSPLRTEFCFHSP